MAHVTALPQACVSAPVEEPPEATLPLADIHVVGYGNRLPNDFTLEMLAALRRCRRVFGVPPIHAPGLSLPAMESLMRLYRRGRRHDEIYDEMACTVIDAATRHAPIGFATYGSAMVGMPVCHLILERSQRVGLSAHVSAAPSSLDGVWAALAEDPADGSQMWDATAFLTAAAEPNPRAILLLGQVMLLALPGSGHSVAVLREHLLRFYEPDHPVRFVTAEAAVAYAPRQRVDTFKLRDLAGPGREALSMLVVERRVR